MIAAEFGHLPIMKLLDNDARKPNMKLKVRSHHKWIRQQFKQKICCIQLVIKLVITSDWAINFQKNRKQDTKRYLREIFPRSQNIKFFITPRVQIMAEIFPV